MSETTIQEPCFTQGQGPTQQGPCFIQGQGPQQGQLPTKQGFLHQQDTTNPTAYVNYNYNWRNNTNEGPICRSHLFKTAFHAANIAMNFFVFSFNPPDYLLGAAIGSAKAIMEYNETPDKAPKPYLDPMSEDFGRRSFTDKIAHILTEYGVYSFFANIEDLTPPGSLCTLPALTAQTLYTYSKGYAFAYDLTQRVINWLKF